MLDPMKNRRIDREGVMEKFGVGPERVVDVQALAGDSVDNVPGAPGIGVKTAALLINEFGTLEDLLDRAEEIKQPKRRQTLIEKREQIELSKRLVLLDANTPLDFTLDDLQLRDPDPEVLLGFLSEMEFRSLSRRVAETLGAEAPVIPETAPEAADPDDAPEMPPFDEAIYETVTDAEGLKAWIDAAYRRGWVAVDTETTGLNEMACDLVGVSLAVEPGHAAYLPLAHRGEGDGGLFGDGDVTDGQMGMQEALDLLKPLLEDPAIMKIGQNMKYDAKVLGRYGIDIATIVPVKRQLKQEFGFTTPGGNDPYQSPTDGARETEMVTGDLNAALVEWVVQYRISDPAKFLFEVREPAATLRYVSESVMREVVGDRTVDEVITIIGSADNDGNSTTIFRAHPASLDRVLLVTANAMRLLAWKGLRDA